MIRPIISILILLLGGLLLAGIGVRTSLNRTEVAHLGAAAYFWQTGKSDLFHVNPPLGRMVIGLPIILCRPDYDWSAYSPRPQDRSEWAVGTAFIHANPTENIRRMFVLGRLACIPVILLGGWFGFRLASDLFGYASGLVFITLWSFSPLFLGWGATLCPDLMAAALGLTTCYFFRRWLHDPSWKKVVVTGICIGLLPLTKLTWVIAFGLFPLLWLLSTNRPPLKQLLVVLLLALYTLNMGYFFDGSFRLLKDYTFISESLRGETTNRFENSVLGYMPVPLPGEFVLGVDTQKRDFEKGLESYLFGRHAERGWWYYYPIVLAFKEPLGTLVLALIAVFLCFRREYRASWNDEILIFIPFIALFGLMMSQTGFSIHPRYLLPALPFFYLFTARIGKSFALKQKLFQFVTVACLAWMTASSLWSYPYSLSYFNEILPVRERPKMLLGSNIDWGQDAYFLREYLTKHPEIKSIRIAYSCPETIERIRIETAGEPPSEPEPGWFALGVNDLYAASKRYAWLQNEEPGAVVGRSIYVFHIVQVNGERGHE